MSSGAYEVLALAMRYVFAGLMLLIVLRALRGVFTDSRRAGNLRRLSPETGIIGELLVTAGDGRARTGTRYPLTLEGTIGSARTADIRVRSNTVRGRHAIYRMTERGLYVRGHAGNTLCKNKGRPCREVLLADGDTLRIGFVDLLLVLTEANDVPDEMRRHVRRRDADAHARRRGPAGGQDTSDADIFMTDTGDPFDTSDEEDLDT